MSGRNGTVGAELDQPSVYNCRGLTTGLAPEESSFGIAARLYRTLSKGRLFASSVGILAERYTSKVAVDACTKSLTRLWYINEQYNARRNRTVADQTTKLATLTSIQYGLTHYLCVTSAG